MAKLVTIQQNEQETEFRKSVKRRFKQKSARVLFNQLRAAVVEKDVENAWRKAFSEYFVENGPKGDDNRITSPYEVDGFISAQNGNLMFALRLLMEFKYGTDLTKNHDRARIMCQCIHYMKKFEEHGDRLPTIIVGADEDQAFVLIASKFYKYLKGDYDWSVAPNQAYLKDKKLMKDLLKDKNMEVYPFSFVGGNFKERYDSLIDMFQSISSIVNSNGKGKYKVKVSSATILGMFDTFNHLAFREPEKVPPVAQVNMFMQMITGRNVEEYYFIPRNHNLYHLPNDKKIRVFGYKIESFLSHYDRNFTPTEIDQLTSIADRLIEVNTRRFKGDFWTPEIWAKRADSMMKDTIAPDYKEKSIVWDCAAGVRNLTRDFVYSNLYISTYHMDEIELGNGYNPEAKAAFQYDFLNDDFDLTPENTSNADKWKMPNVLFNALLQASKTEQPIVFYTNPPYGTATNVKADGSSKANIAKSKTNDYMKKHNYGKAAQQLYCQFFVRIMKLVKDFQLKNVYIGFFTNARFFAGGDYYKKFNEKFFKRFSFQKGCLLNAGEFSDTSSTWPITFSVYKYNSKDDNKIPEIECFTVEKSKLELGISTNETTKVVGHHKLAKIYKDESLSEWAREPLKKLDLELMDKNTYPQLSSALNCSKGKNPYGRLYKNSLGYEVSNSNNIGEGTWNGGVWLVSGSAYKGHGFNVMPANFERACVNFAARRVVEPTWYNAQDNYKAPDISNPLYNELVNDALVYSIFESESYQTALREPAWTNMGIPGKWANQWFWLPYEYVKEEVSSISDLLPIYDDMRGDTDRFVAKEIQKRDFSKEATKVLENAKLVWKDTLEYRGQMFDDSPEYYLQAWDAGWFQVKRINNLFPSAYYEDFQNSMNILKDKILQRIYNLEMLVQ